MKPLFPWAGGKTRMIKHYQLFLPSRFEYNAYVEPFFGAGAMYCYLKTQNPGLKSYINDINTGVTNIYNTIKTDVDNFLTVVDDLDKKYIPLGDEDRKSFYENIRYQHAWHYEDWTKTEENAHLFFLIRTSFNGMQLKSKTFNNRFATAMGSTKQLVKSIYDVDNVLAWNRALQTTTITNVDWKQAIEGIPYDNTFFFFDPPYRESEITYPAFGEPFTDDDQVELLNTSININNNGGIVFFCNRDDNDNFWEGKTGTLKTEKFEIKSYTGGRWKMKHKHLRTRPADVLFHS